MSTKKGQKLCVQANARIETPPVKWLNARNLSAAKFRSTNCVLKNIAVNEARAKALRIHDCSSGPNPRLGRYAYMRGSKAPQMKNSKNIMIDSLRITVTFLGIGWSVLNKSNESEAKYVRII